MVRQVPKLYSDLLVMVATGFQRELGSVMDKQEIIDVLWSLINWDRNQGWNTAPCWLDVRALIVKLEREQKEEQSHD